MKNEIIAAVLGSLLTSMAGFFVLSSMGILEKEIKDSQVRELADEIINNKSYRETLIGHMRESKKFIGDRGEKGEKGDIGPAGEKGDPWRANLTHYSLQSNKNSPKQESKSLGVHTFCALSVSGDKHHFQACSCIVEQKKSAWTLRINLDLGVKGACVCGAICVDV